MSNQSAIPHIPPDPPAPGPKKPFPGSEEDVDWALESLLEEMKDVQETDLRIIVEHRLVRLESEDGEIITYDQDLWEDDPNIVTQMVEDIVIGRKGIGRLKERIERRKQLYNGDVYGRPITNAEAVKVGEELRTEQAKAEETECPTP